MRIGGGAVSIADVTDRTARDLGFVRPFWLNEIRAGRAFVGGGESGPGVGNFAQFQLINVAGGGVDVIVYRVEIFANTAGLFRVATHNANLTIDAGAGINLLAGGAVANSHHRREEDGTQDGTVRSSGRIRAEETRDVIPKWGWELGNGEGLLVRMDVVNIESGVNFYWIEV